MIAIASNTSISRGSASRLARFPEMALVSTIRNFDEDGGLKTLPEGKDDRGQFETRYSARFELATGEKPSSERGI